MESMLNREWRGAIVSVATDSTGVGFLRRKTNPFMERKENHMIIARAAKGAALLLMIFGVVAFIGCQGAGTTGPSGPAGPKGDPGTPGTAGGQGPQGTPGPAALQAKSGGAYSLVFNATGDDGDEIGDLTSPNGGSLDLSDAFIGGVPPVTYEATGTTENDRIKVVVAEDGMATVTKKEGATAYILVDFTTGFNFTVTATDANKITAQTSVTVTANRKPQRQVQNFDVPSNGLPGAGTRTELAFVVGTQPKLGEGNSVKVAWNKFEARSRNTVAAGRGMLVGSNSLSHWVFRDENPEDVEITITEVGAAGEADDEEYIMAEVTKAGWLTVTGVKSTWNADASTPIHEPVPVEFTATDPGGLTETLTAYVWVDGAPVQDPDAPLQASYIVKKADGTNNVIGNLGGFFKDPEGATTVQLVNADVSSSNELVATAAIAGTGTGTALAVTPVNPGNATITVYGSAASNTAGGNAAINASSTVAAAVDRNGDGTVDADDGDTEAANGVLPGAQFGVLTVNVQVIP